MKYFNYNIQPNKLSKTSSPDEKIMMKKKQFNWNIMNEFKLNEHMNVQLKRIGSQ